MNAQTGDTVVFDYRGKHINGTIVRFRIHTRRKLKRAAERLGLSHQFDTQTEVAEIAVINKGIYTVPRTNIVSITGKDSSMADEAKQYAHNLKNHNAQVKQERSNQSYEWAKEHGLLPIGAGAPVWVKYTGNLIRQETFLSLTNSWQVRIRSVNGERSISPKFVFVDRKQINEPH